MQEKLNERYAETAFQLVYHTEFQRQVKEVFQGYLDGGWLDEASALATEYYRRTGSAEETAKVFGLSEDSIWIWVTKQEKDAGMIESMEMGTKQAIETAREYAACFVRLALMNMECTEMLEKLEPTDQVAFDEYVKAPFVQPHYIPYVLDGEAKSGKTI